MPHSAFRKMQFPSHPVRSACCIWKRCAFPEKVCNYFIFMILEFLLNALFCFHVKLWNCPQNPLHKALKPNTRVWGESFVILTNFLSFAPFAILLSPGNFIPKALITSEKHFYASLECILESILLVLTTVKGLCIPLHTHFMTHVHWAMFGEQRTRIPVKCS